jgi:hypothetical protein
MGNKKSFLFFTCDFYNRFSYFSHFIRRVKNVSNIAEILKIWVTAASSSSRSWSSGMAMVLRDESSHESLRGDAASMAQVSFVIICFVRESLARKSSVCVSHPIPVLFILSISLLRLSHLVVWGQELMLTRHH